MEDIKNIKILIIGDADTGKTCILKAYTQNEYDYNTQSTIGVNYLNKIVDYDGYELNLELWDTAGQERFQSLTKLYFNGAQGCLIVYDITNEESFNNLDKWLAKAKESCPDIPIILIGNKSDLKEERKVDKQNGEDYAKKNNLAFFETSAKENINIKEAFKRLVGEIVENTGLLEKLKKLPKEEIPILLNPDSDKDEEDSDESDDNNIKSKSSSKKRQQDVDENPNPTIKLRNDENDDTKKLENYKCC